MKKKILFVIMHLHIGGAERSLVNLLNEIDHGSYDVDLILIKKEGELIRQLPKEVHLLDTPDELKSVYSNSIKGIRGTKFFLIRVISILYSSVKNGIKRCDVTAIRWNKFYNKCIPEFDTKYDTAIAYLNGPSMYYVAEKVNATRKIVFYHSDYISSNGKVNQSTDNRFFEKFDFIPTISEKCKESLEIVFPEFKNKFVVVPNITSDRLVTMRAEEAKPIEYIGLDNINIICSVGRLSVEKGFDLAIQAAVILEKKGINFKWFVVGEGDERKKLQSMIKNYCLENQFVLLGIRDNPYPYMKNADIIVQSSRFEGKSMVLDEAKILKKPIIVTNYTTVRDQLSNDEGLIVEMTADGIADGIRHICNDKNMREKFKNRLQESDKGNRIKMQSFYDILD